jgi:spore germination cell wall hydrolase CwlJ-like protein
MNSFLIIFTSFFLVSTVAAKQEAGFLNSYYIEGKNQVHLVNDHTLKQLDCLAKNIYWEAQGESYEGKVAVAQVTINRLRSGKYGSSICHVVYQRERKNNVTVCQFSWTCTNKTRINPRNRKLFRESEEIAARVFLEDYRISSIRTAMYFHSESINPRWKKVRIAQIGGHIFYRD